MLPRFPAHAKRVVQEFLHSQDLNKSISVLKEKKSVVLLVVVMVAPFQVIISFKFSLVKRMGMEKAGTAGPQSLKT